MELLKRIHASIQARYVRPWMVKHFEKTKYGKALSVFRNKYAGQRCFFVGNGPSLRPEDLTAIHNAGIPTFAFNRVYNIFDQTPWRPTFYISQDEKMLAGCAETVNDLTLPCKLIPVQLDWWHDIKIDRACYFNIQPQTTEDPRDFKFSDDASRCVYNSSTGMYTAAQLAAYMGFKEIYLIGVDHHFHISQNNKGEIVVDNNVKDYFSEKYNEDKASLYIPNTEKSTLTYVAMKDHCDKRGIRVCNATRGGKLEVFPRVNFDDLFQGNAQQK